MSTKERPLNYWLDAETESEIKLHTLPGCMTLCDLKNDNYYKLVAADVPMDFDGNSKLKVFKGTNLASEQGLPGIPSAVINFYINEPEPRTPIVAVSIGSTVLFYRNMKPYFKFTLPNLEVSAIEKEIWRKLPLEKHENIEKQIKSLKSLGISNLTSLSQQLIFWPEEKREEFIKEHVEASLERHSTITVMTTMLRASTEDNAPSCVILGSESGDIFFLDTQSFTVLSQAKTFAFKASPALISATGQYDVDYQIVIVTREGYLCLLRKGMLEGQLILKLEHPATGLALLPIDQTIIVVSMDKTLVCTSKKGKKLWGVTLPAAVVCMTPLHLAHLSLTIICVGLQNGLVQLYAQKKLVDQFTMESTISAMTFGRLGQEDHVLLLATVDGKLLIKILKRTADFSKNLLFEDKNSISTEDHFLIPKKSKVFLEQTIRERDNAAAIHNSFQTELWRLRLTAARETVEIISTSESSLSGDVVNAPIKMSAEVFGLGPEFVLSVKLENLSARKEATHLAVLLHADHRHYSLDKPYARLPPLVPGAPLLLSYKVTAVLDSDNLPPIDLTPENSVIRVLLIRAGQVKPLIASTIVMPQVENEMV